MFFGQAHAQTRVIDGDTLKINGTTFRINGIDAPEAGQTCTDENGREWACGDAATNALFEIVQGKTVACSVLAEDGYGRKIADCVVAGESLGASMVARGMAWAFVKYSDVYEQDENRARAQRLGIWRGPATPAWEFRSELWARAAQTAPKGCPIKGNISRNGKIYHPPWSPWYSKTYVNTSKGERWFCDESEAIAAGWRAPIWK